MCRFYAEMYCLCGNACLTTHQVSFNTANTSCQLRPLFLDNFQAHTDISIHFFEKLKYIGMQSYMRAHVAALPPEIHTGPAQFDIENMSKYRV